MESGHWSEGAGIGDRLWCSRCAVLIAIYLDGKETCRQRHIGGQEVGRERMKNTKYHKVE